MQVISRIAGSGDSLLEVLRSGRRNETFLLVGNAINAVRVGSHYADLVTTAAEFNTFLVPAELVSVRRRSQIRLIAGVAWMDGGEAIEIHDRAAPAWG